MTITTERRSFIQGAGLVAAAASTGNAGGGPRIRPKQSTERRQGNAVSTKTTVTRPEVDQGHLGKGFS